MSTAQSTVEVDVPVSTAYNQWTQFESFPHFMSSVESVQSLGDSRSHWVVKVAGAEREYDAEVTAQEPDKHLAWHSIGELKQGGKVSFEPLGPNSTKIHLELSWEPEGFVEKVGDMLGIDDTTVKKDLEAFKEFIEGRAA